MTAPTARPDVRSSRLVYWILVVVLVVLLAVMLIAWNYDRASNDAVRKAEQLISQYESAGLPTPASAENVAAVLGDDGAVVCATAGSEQQLGYLKTRLGVGGEFYLRPAIVGEHVVQGLVLIVQTYCPENLPTVENFVSGLRFDS